MIDAGEIGSDLFAAAGHEADLLGHPYVGVEHVALAKVRSSGDATAYELRRKLARRISRPWWHVRGPRSALRRKGRAQAAAARQAAEALEAGGGTLADELLHEPPWRPPSSAKDGHWPWTSGYEIDESEVVSWGRCPQCAADDHKRTD